MQNSDMKVAFIVPDICYQTRRILKGIHRYMMTNTNWHLRLACRIPPNRIIDTLSEAEVNGAFVSIRSKNIDRKLLNIGLPCIAVTCLKIPHNMPYITSNSFDAGKVIAEYFLERGYHNFAYFSPSNIFWSEPRKNGFCQRIVEAGYSVNVYKPKVSGKTKLSWQEIGQAWIKGTEEPVNWLKSLPKPIGLMVCDDGVGYDLIEVAGEAGIRIPEEISVMSVDNNDILCDSARPPLSSVETNFEQAGYEAAELLNAAMTSQKDLSNKPILGRVSRVVIRQSSDVLAINDSQVAAALHFIHKNFNSPIQVSDVVKITYLSRRALEKKFKKLIKRSILEEIMRVRIEHIVELLLKSHLSIDQIASSSTFNSTSHLIRTFKKHKGVPPRTFRNTHGIT